MNKEFLYQTKKIFYQVIGKGKPVMLIHGFGEDAGVWKNQLGPPQTPPKEGLPNTQSQLAGNSLLIEKFKFIIPDLPGSGRSEMIADMSMEGMAEVIKSILDREASPNPSKGEALDSDTSNKLYKFEDAGNPPLDGQPSKAKVGAEGREACIIIGHSMGGYILLAFVEKYPNHLDAFGLFHSSAYPDSEEKKAVRRKGIEFIRQHGAFTFLETATPNLFSDQTRDERPGLVDEQVESLHNFSPATLVSYYEAMMQRPDRTEMLRKAAVPVLFIMGKYDKAVPLEDMLEQCHLPEKSYIHILRQSGHMGMLEEKDKCNGILEKFLWEI